MQILLDFLGLHLYDTINLTAADILKIYICR